MWRNGLVGIVIVLISFAGHPATSSMNILTDTSLFINRSARMLYVLAADGSILHKFACSIGKGGLGEKHSMRDHITPTGDFTIDLLLSREAEYNAVMPTSARRYGDGTEEAALLQPSGLSKLFQNMNGLDFDNDGSPDHAFGSAYLGLDGHNIITGPKLRRFGKTLYWYSIALHGTPNEKTIGSMISGGCLHLSADVLALLIANHMVTVGTRVLIRDNDPPSVAR